MSDNKDNSNGAFFLDPDSNPMRPYYQNSIELQALNDLTMILKDGKLIIDNNSCFRLNACNLMSYLFIVQDYTGYNFSLSEIASIITYGQETTNPSKTSEMSLLNNYDVRNPDVIMNKAFEMTGHPELTATAGHNIGNLPCRTYTNIKVITGLDNEHRVVGDFEGNVIYNPWKGGDIKSIMDSTKVYVQGVMKKEITFLLLSLILFQLSAFDFNGTWSCNGVSLKGYSKEEYEYSWGIVKEPSHSGFSIDMGKNMIHTNDVWSFLIDLEYDEENDIFRS